MGGQVVYRRIGGGQDLETEAPEKRPRSVLGRAQALCDLIVRLVSRLLLERAVDPEQVGQLVFEPQAHDRTAKCRPMTAQLTPHLSRLGDGPGLRAVGHAQLRQGHTVGVEQADDIVVGPDQEGNRVRVWLVVGQDGRVHVTMR